MIITNGKIITWANPNEILENQALLILNDTIVRIDSFGLLREDFPHEEVLDAKGQYIMPGLICAHTHFYSAYSRGLAIPGDPPSGFS